LPFVVGMAWLLANLVRPAADRERHAFACAGSVRALAMFPQSTELGPDYTGYVPVLVLLHLVPASVISELRAVPGPRPLVQAPPLPAAVVALGFGAGALPRMTWADPNRLVLPDTPASIFYDPIVRLVDGLSAARVLLVAVTLVSTALFALAAA